jgi:hypothetical protein
MKRKHLMPEAGSRAHRVFVEMARHEGPVEEQFLMDRHGLDGLSPTVWRQGPYKALASSALIVKIKQSGWQLTKLGRAVMDEVEADMTGQVGGVLMPNPVAAAPADSEPGKAAPRGPVPFRPLSRQCLQRPIRQGAYDYRDIPSLHHARRQEEAT